MKQQSNTIYSETYTLYTEIAAKCITKQQYNIVKQQHNTYRNINTTYNEIATGNVTEHRQNLDRRSSFLLLFFIYCVAFSL